MTNQTKAEVLRALAEPVREWSARNEAWKHPDPDCEGIAMFGYVNEDGEQYPAAEVNVDTYGHEGASLRLAQFYAAATPEVVLGLLDRITALEAQAQLAGTEAKHWRSNHDNLAARLRVFTQRPDLPKELADRLPWYRELVRLQELEAQAQAQPAREPRCAACRYQHGHAIGCVNNPVDIAIRALGTKEGGGNAG